MEREPLELPGDRAWVFISLESIDSHPVLCEQNEGI